MLQMPVNELGAGDVGCIAFLVAALCLGLRTVTESGGSRNKPPVSTSFCSDSHCDSWTRPLIQ